MAETSHAPEIQSSDNFSGQEGSSTKTVLEIKGNNRFYDVVIDILPTSLQPMALYLMNSPIKTAISVRADVPVSVLTLAYTTSFYDSVNDVVKFMVPGSTTHKVLSRTKFLRLLGLEVYEHSNELVANPENIDSGFLSAIVLEMGYNTELLQLSSLKKN